MAFRRNGADFDKAKPIYFTLFEKTYSSFDAKEGDEVTVDFSIESREWEGKYFTDVIGWAVSVTAPKNAQPTPSAKNATPVAQETFQVPDNSGGFEDDLPF